MDHRDNYKWGVEEFTPLELLERYKDSFPRIVRVTQGFRGNQAWECLSQAEIFLVHCCMTQKRAVAKDPHGRYYSLATTYNGHFYPVKHKKKLSKKAKPLSELLEHYKIPFEVEVEKEDTVLKTGLDQQSQSLQLQHLLIVDTYEERFMKANLIRPEGLNKHVLKIASYSKAKVAVSQSESILRKVTHAAKQIDLTAHDTSQQILMYSKSTVEDKEDTTEENIYETIEPTKMLATSAVYETIASGPSSGYVECIHDSKPDPVQIYRTSLNEFKKSTDRGRRPSLPNIYSQSPVQVLPSRPNLPPRGRRFSTDTAGAQMSPRTPSPRDTIWKGVPSDISHLTCDELADCLKLLHLEKFRPAFIENLIDGALLNTLDVEDLKKDLNMSGLEAKKLFKFAREGWRPEETLREAHRTPQRGALSVMSTKSY